MYRNIYFQRIRARNLTDTLEATFTLILFTTINY